MCYQQEENEIYNEKSMEIRLVPEMENASEDHCRPHFLRIATVFLKLLNLIHTLKKSFSGQMEKQFFLDCLSHGERKIRTRDFIRKCLHSENYVSNATERIYEYFQRKNGGNNTKQTSKDFFF